jgi:HEPN domain-containing protein
MMKQITKDWLEAASMDIESIGYLIQDERLTGQVAFHAQQAIEKSLKALIEEHGDRVPKIHSLSKLFDICEVYIKLDPIEDLIIALDSLYLESRYPGDFGLLPAGKPTIKQTQLFYNFAKDIFHLIKHHLETGK